MEFVGQRTYTRDSILAAFGVPPTRVGLPSANYATAQEQSKIYWRQLQGIAALIDDALTELALGWGAYRVAHDFSSVDALQESRDARLNRVASWTMLGASPSDAAAYEGFQDAPLSDSTDQAQAEPVAVGASVRPVRAVQPKTLTFADWWTTKELDPEDPRLEQSEYARPPFGYVRSLKADYPEIWGAGGNERGNEAFEFWTKYQDGDRSEGVLAWLKEREAWAARHYEDGDAFTGSEPESPTISNIGGVIAWLKWGVVGQLGWDRIKSLVDALKEQQASAGDEREIQRTAVWRGWLDEIHTPGEAALARSVKLALAQQAGAIAERMGVLIPDARAVTRDAGALSALVDALFTADIQALLRTLTLEAYRATVRAAYQRAARQVGQSLAGTRADPLVEQLLAVMVANVNGATKDMIATVISNGLATGATVAAVVALAPPAQVDVAAVYDGNARFTRAMAEFDAAIKALQHEFKEKEAGRKSERQLDDWGRQTLLPRLLWVQKELGATTLSPTDPRRPFLAETRHMVDLLVEATRMQTHYPQDGGEGVAADPERARALELEIKASGERIARLVKGTGRGEGSGR
jgi:hypothetical protein